jgi:hypothetical protein
MYLHETIQRCLQHGAAESSCEEGRGGLRALQVPRLALWAIERAAAVHHAPVVEN